MTVFEVRSTLRNTELSAADLYGEPKDVPSATAVIPCCPKCGGIFVRLAGGLCRCTKPTCRHEWTEERGAGVARTAPGQGERAGSTPVAPLQVHQGIEPPISALDHIPGMAAEGAGPRFDPPAKRYRAIKARNPKAVVYLSVCCGREQTHSGPTRYCAFCGRECVGVVYEPELATETQSHGEEQKERP